MKFLKIMLVSAIFLVVSCKTSKYTDLSKGLYADIQTNKGDILIKLYAEEIPLTVANFVSLAEGTNPKLQDSLKGKRYYDGIKFHRVILNFMIQGGDPTGTGSGGPGYKFGDEFPKNDNYELIYKHNGAGILSMANSGPATNGSQFFITHKETPWLDGNHTVFGKVIGDSSEIKELSNKIQDSIKLLKSIDSLRMKVINNIVKNDVINHIEIIRVGKKARKFDAAKVFESELKKMTEKEKIESEKYEAAKKVFLSKMNEEKAKETDSGLKILTIKKGRGKKVDGKHPITVNYTLYTADGTKIDFTEEGKPFTFTIEQRLIEGWIEGVLTMRQGGKARLFIPSYLGYGEKGSGSIPPKSDLVFDIEVIKIGE